MFYYLAVLHLAVFYYSDVKRKEVLRYRRFSNVGDLRNERRLITGGVFTKHFYKVFYYDGVFFDDEVSYHVSYS